MPRDSNGVYTLPVTAAVSGSVISSNKINTVFEDIADALTESLATNGSSAMTGPLKADNGSLAAPSYTFAADTDTGFYLSGTNEFALVVGGALAGTFKSDLSVEWEGTHTFSGGLSVTGTTSVSGTVEVSTHLDVSGSATFSEIATFEDIVNFQATVSFSATVLVSGGLYVNQFIELPSNSVPTSAAANSIRLFVNTRDDIDKLAWVDDDGNVSELAFILLAAGSVSGASSIDITFTQYPYKSLLVRLVDIRPSADAADLYLRASDDGGSTYESGASDYAWNLMYANASTFTSSGLTTLGDAADTEIQLSDNQEISTNTSLEGLYMDIYVMGANDSGQGFGSTFFWSGTYRYSTSSNALVFAEGGGYTTAEPTDAVRIFYASGNIISGKYYLYGLS